VPWPEGVARRRAGAASVSCSAMGCLERADAAGSLAGAGARGRGCRPGVGGCGRGGGLARAEAGVACFAAARRCAAAAARAREEEGRGGSYIRLCRAMDQGAIVPRQDRWCGRALPR